jgi:cell division protein FtsL
MAQNTMYNYYQTTAPVLAPEVKPKQKRPARTKVQTYAAPRWQAKEIALAGFMATGVVVMMLLVVLTTWQNSQVNMKMQAAENQITQTKQSIDNMRDNINTQTSKASLTKLADKYGLVKNDQSVRNINN